MGPLLYLAVQMLLQMGPLLRFITTRCSCKAGQRKLKPYGDNIASSFLQSSLLPSNRAGHTNFDFEAQDEYNFHFAPATLLSLIASLPRVIFKMLCGLVRGILGHRTVAHRNSLRGPLIMPLRTWFLTLFLLCLRS